MEKAVLAVERFAPSPPVPEESIAAVQRQRPPLIAEIGANLPGGFQPADPLRPPSASEVGLATANVPAAFERAIRAGAVSVAAPKVKPWGQTVAYLRDPDGHLIELCTPMS